MTNGDVIRNMTDEEIADFLLSEDANACSHCEYYDHETQRCYLDNPCVTELSRLCCWNGFHPKQFPNVRKTQFATRKLIRKEKPLSCPIQKRKEKP